MTYIFRRALAYLWVAPVTAAALGIGVVALLTGGRGQIVRGAVEFWGGFARWVLRSRFLCRGASAVTLGHVILGQDRHCLEWARDHEHVHVRQFERWGVLMVPAYFGSSLWAWLRGRHFYWDNAFEKEAYRLAPSQVPQR